MKKLLIVDDDTMTRRLLLEAFKYDYLVREAADGITALKIVLQEQPDVLILDGRLPRLDGLAVLAAIKSDPQMKHILVVMMTGRGQFSDLERGVTLGADAYFIKPVSPNTLKTWILENMPQDEG
ncbi:MAG: response regulator [Polaromonas sp.]|nr:response regulator [Polaromonas sp.]